MGLGARLVPFALGKTCRLFTVYTRPRRRGKLVCYVRYREPGGGWTIARCTGQTSEGAAETYALEQLRTGAVAPIAGEVHYNRRISCRTGAWCSAHSLAVAPRGRFKKRCISFVSQSCRALVSYMLIPERGYA